MTEFTATLRTVTSAADPFGKPVPSFRYKWPDEKQWVEREPNRVPSSVERDPALGSRTWDHAAGKSTTGGLGTPYHTFASELPVGAIVGGKYRYRMLPAETPEAFGQPDTEAGRTEAAERAMYVKELFGRRYNKAVKNDDAARSFQIALWELVHEARPPKGETTFDLTQGTFRADYEDFEKAPKHVRDAQDWLGQLAGNDRMLSQYCPGTELVWLKGLASPDAGGAVPQSQFALVTIEVRSDAIEDGAGLSGFVSTSTSSQGNRNSPSSNLSGGSGNGGQGGGKPFQPGSGGGPPVGSPFSPGGLGGPGGSSPFTPGGTGGGNPPIHPDSTGSTTLGRQPFLPGQSGGGGPGAATSGGTSRNVGGSTTGTFFNPGNPVPAPGGALLAGVAVLTFTGRRLIQRYRATPP